MSSFKFLFSNKIDNSELLYSDNPQVTFFKM